MLSFLAISSEFAISEEKYKRIILSCEKYLPQGFQLVEHINSDCGKSHLFIWTYQNSKTPFYIVDNERRVAALNGYVTAFSPNDKRDFESKLVHEGKYSDFKDSPGGIYSLICMEKTSGRVSAAQSYSGIAPVYVTQSHGITAISDRAIISHLACESRGAEEAVRPTIDFNFLPEILKSNFLIDGSTPLLNTRRVNKDQVAVLERGQIAFYRRSLTRPSSQNLDSSDFDQLVDAFDQTLKETCRAFDWTSPPVLRISDGKDSRLLASLFKSLDVDFSMENHNLRHHFAGAMVDKIAATIGQEPPHRNVPDLRDPTELFKTGTILRGGMLNPVPLHYPFDTQISDDGGTLVLGHAHHLRGGFARTMGNVQGGYLGYVTQKFQRPTIKPDFMHRSEVFFENYFATRKVPHLLHWSYWSYSDLRVPGYLAQHFTEASSKALLVYPLLDERLLLAIDEIISTPDGFFAVVSEKLFFALIKRYNEELAAMPLGDKIWRFDVDAPPKEFVEGFETRRIPFNSSWKEEQDPDAYGTTKSDQAIFDVNSFVRQNRNWPLLRSIMSDAFIDFVEGRSPQIEGLVAKESKESLYCAFGALSLIDTF